jgi:hypothetical protein
MKGEFVGKSGFDVAPEDERQFSLDIKEPFILAVLEEEGVRIQEGTREGDLQAVDDLVSSIILTFAGVIGSAQGQCIKSEWLTNIARFCLNHID